MSISRMSAHALRVLEAHPTLHVHSSFTAAVNLRADDRLLTCSTGGASAPNGIELSVDDLALLTSVRSGAPLRWVDRAITGEAGLTIRATDSTVVFDPVLQPARHRSTFRLDGVIADLDRIDARTGFGSDWVSLIADDRFVAALGELREGQVNDAVRHLLGRGPGLTPSGDDVLVGMLAALRFTSAIDLPGLARLEQILDSVVETLTTQISREQLRCACHGMVIGPLHDLLTALDRERTADVRAAVSLLQRYGHTSGMDCLLGTLIALPTPTN